MSQGTNSIDNKNEIRIMSVNSNQDKLDSHSNRKMAEELLQESSKYATDSNEKKEQAQKYLQVAQALEKMADAVRLKAQQLRSGEIAKDKAVEEVAAIVGAVLQMPVPKNATPELLEQIADELESRAKESRTKAEDLMKDSRKSLELSLEMQQKAEAIVQKELNLTDLNLKSIISRAEGLKMVFEKLGVFKLDSMYRQQVSDAQKKAHEKSKRE